MPAAYEFLQLIELLLLCQKRCSLLSGLLVLLFDLIPLAFEFVLLVFDLQLLFFESVDEDNGELIVFDAFNLAHVVPESKEGRDLVDLFRGEANVVNSAFLPIKGDWPQLPDEVQTSGKRLDVCLVAKTGNVAKSDLINDVQAQWWMFDPQPTEERTATDHQIPTTGETM